jgi:hypothetical protein
MNTTGIQNYLSNVFRPIYTYDTTTTNFIPKLTMSNIYNYTGNTISVFTAAVGDSNSNVYVGSNAGNPYDITRNVFNVTALGYGAASNISNDSNSIYIGWYAGSGGSNSTNVISIGTNSGGNGSENIFIGTDTGSVGTSNVLIGHFIDLSSSSNQVRIGYRNQIPIAADLSKNWVGLGGVLTPSYPYNKLDVSGNAVFIGNVGINKDASSSSVAGNRTLDVNGNFRATDSSTNILDFKDGITRSFKGFNSDSSTIIIPYSGSTIIGTLRKGLISLTASDGVGAYNSRIIYVDELTTPTIGVLCSNVTGASPPVFQYTTSNIIISNTVIAAGNVTYAWSITYFPSP